MKTLDDFTATVPSDLRDQAAAAGCVEAGFGAGPGCIAGKVEAFDPPAPLSDAVAWVHARSHFYKRAHIRLADGFVLWFGPRGFDRAERRSAAPLPGLVVRTTDPTSDDSNGSLDGFGGFAYPLNVGNRCQEWRLP